MHVALRVGFSRLVDFDSRRPELSYGLVDPLHQEADRARGIADATWVGHRETGTVGKREHVRIDTAGLNRREAKRFPTNRAISARRSVAVPAKIKPRTSTRASYYDCLPPRAAAT